MRILHVIPSLSPKRGGPSFAVRTIAEAVIGHDTDVHIVTTDDDGQGRLAVTLDEPIRENGVTLHYFQRQTKFYNFSWPLTRWLWAHVHEYDLLHIHSLFSYSTLPAAWFAYWRNVPYIIRPLGHLNRWGMANRRSVMKRFSLRWIEGPILQRASLLHFTCEQERVEAHEVGARGPSVVAPLGIDTVPFRHLPSKEAFIADYPQSRNKVRLLFLSRIDPKKGLDILLAAFAELRGSYPELVLVIAGDGDAAYLAELKALAQQLNIADAIVWTDFLAGATKLAALAAADLFVLPSYSENFGIAVVEAMAAGLPVVISDQVGIHHEVSKSNAGLVTSCEVESLVAALHKFVVSPSIRHQLGSNGTQLVSEIFSQAAMTTRLSAMYEQALAPKAPSPSGYSPSVSNASK